MRGAHYCEVYGWRLGWLARLFSRELAFARLNREGLGDIWQRAVFATAVNTKPRRDVQGPGRGTLFGRHGASGMAVEFDTAVDDGQGILSLVEAKAVADFALRRDATFVLAAKIVDHESAPHFRWLGVHAQLASAGRLDGIVCRWCYRQGIDVSDPDRFPLNVLARLPFVLSRKEFAVLRDHHRFDWLHEVLQISREEIANGPVLLRRPARLARLTDVVLHDLNDIHAKLSESVWAAVVEAATGQDFSEESEHLILERARNEFVKLGVGFPSVVPAVVRVLKAQDPHGPAVSAITTVSRRERPKLSLGGDS